MRLVTRFDVYLCEAALACFAVFGFAICGLFILADAAQRIIRWSHSDAPLMSFIGCLFVYYGVTLPSILADLLPVCWTIAVVVTVFFLQRRNEIAAFNVHGVSVRRVMAPVFVLSVGVGGLVVLCNETIVPTLANTVRAYEQIVAWRTHGEKLIVPAGGGNTFYWINSSDMRRGKLDKVTMISYDENARPQDALWAEEAVWENPKRLLLRDVWAPWCGSAKGRQKAMHYDELPAPTPITRDMVLAAETPTDMTSARAARALMESMPGNRFFTMAYYDHFVRPLAPLLFVLLAIPLVVGNEFTEGGSARGILLCLILCAGYYAVKSLCHNLGATGNISPAQAVWLPVVLFAAIGLYLFSSIRT